MYQAWERVGFSRFAHSLQGAPARRSGLLPTRTLDGPFSVRNQKRMSRPCVFLSPNISVFTPKSGVFLTPMAFFFGSPLPRHPLDPCASFIYEKASIKLAFCF